MKGLLGGTFDPPHVGHLVLALRAKDLFGLEEVLLVPSRFPPHKLDRVVTCFDHRFQMASLAADMFHGLRATDLEDRDGPSWTVDLLEKLSLAGEDICFIMGMDSLRDLYTWKDPERLPGLARLVAGTRPGFAPGKQPDSLLGAVETFIIPSLAASSSDLRHRFAHGLDTRYLVPEPVREYIEGNGLYARA